MARSQGLSVIPHGAGHSYSDAALNTHGLIVDTTRMRRILGWDAQRGVVQVEPGVTLRDVVRVALPDGWWPAVTPSTAEATIGGCVAMNVNGKNAWKCGSFGEHVLSLTLLLANGQARILSPESDPQLFRAVVGSAGLLGIIASITLQLQRVLSSNVDVCIRPAGSFGEVLAIFQQEQQSDFLEAWVDGFASGSRLGRGIVSCTRYRDAWPESPREFRTAGLVGSSRLPERLEQELAKSVGKMGRRFVETSVRTANSTAYGWAQAWGSKAAHQRSLFENTYYTSTAYEACRALFPQGTETFHAFVPGGQAEVVFSEIMRRSQANHHMPLWCVIKQHRPDPFLLSYQLDGFSLELNYEIKSQTVQSLRSMLRELMDPVIASGGKFYLAKDSLLTGALYRQSVGNTAVDAFLHLKQQYDPEMLFQSNLFHRVFQEDAS